MERDQYGDLNNEKQNKQKHEEKARKIFERILIPAAASVPYGTQKYARTDSFLRKVAARYKRFTLARSRSACSNSTSPFLTLVA